MNQAESFTTMINEGVSLVDFNAPWCSPCRALEPVIKDLKQEYSGRASVIEVNIDENRDLATRFRVQSIPTLILFNQGREMKRFVGLQSKNKLTRSLDELL